MRESLTPGVWGVVATPFQGSALDVDTDSLAGLVGYYESIGATGLTVLGVFGEAAALTAAERSLVLEVVVEETRLPLVVGVTSLFTGTAVDEIRSIQAATGDRLSAVMVQANSASPGVVIAHLNAIHQSTGANVVLQDYPLASGVHISTEALISVVQACGFVTAVKAEAPPTLRGDRAPHRGPRRLCLRRPRRPGAAGRAHGRRRGGDDRFLLPGSAHRCVQAWQKDGYGAARDALLPYLPLINFEQQAKIALAIRKECLHQRGLIADAGVRAPAAAFPEVLRTGLRTHLAEAAEALGQNPAAVLTTAGRN